MTSYSKEHLSKLANETDFIRDNLEKVIRLIDILEFINNNQYLLERLALKGGTAINLTVFNMPRLSVDIDFDYTLNETKETMLMDKNEIHRIIVGYMTTNQYVFSVHSKNPHTLDSMVFRYVNAVGNNDNIKIEINYGMRCHVLPTEQTTIQIPFLNHIKIQTLNPLELFGGKIKALLERCASRDLYDTNNYLQSKFFHSDNQNLLRKIVLFNLSVGGNESPKTKYLSKSITDISYNQIRGTLIPVLRKSENFNFEEAKVHVQKYIQNLMVLTDNECAFVTNFNKGIYTPELLFDDVEIVDRIKNHPMAIWKISRM